MADTASRLLIINCASPFFFYIPMGCLRPLRLSGATGCADAHLPPLALPGGGFTATFFGEDLLDTLDGLDYVVTGDAELPLWQLLQGRDPTAIANLIRRQSGRALCNAQSGGSGAQLRGDP